MPRLGDIWNFLVIWFLSKVNFGAILKSKTFNVKLLWLLFGQFLETLGYFLIQHLVSLCATLKFVYDIGPPIVPFSTHSRLLYCFLSLSGREKIEILKWKKPFIDFSTSSLSRAKTFFSIQWIASITLKLCTDQTIFNYRGQSNKWSHND